LLYAGAVLLCVAPLAAPAGVVAALAVVPAGILLARRAAVSRLRLPVLVAAMLGVGVLGIQADALVGGPVWVAELLGVKATLLLCQVLTFGLATLGTVVALRVLATRLPFLGVLEVVAVAGVVVFQFAGHRDFHFDQPQSLSDWAFGRGHFPLDVLRGIGMATLGILALLLLRRQRVGQTLTVLGFLLLFCPICCVLIPPEELPRGMGVTPTGAPGGAAGNSPLMEEDPSRDPNTFKPTDKQPPPHPVAVVIFHDDYSPAEGSYYFRSRTYSKFNGRRLVKTDRADADRDTVQSFPTGRVRIDGMVPGPETPEVVDVPGYGKVALFRTVPTTVNLMAKLLRPFGMVAAVTMEPRPNPDPKRFVLSYAVSSRVLNTPAIPAYKVTPEHTKALSAAGVPRGVLAKLKLLVEQKLLATEPLFRQLLGRLLTPAEVSRYQDQIMARCRVQVRVDPYDLLKDRRAGDPRWSEALCKHYLGYPKDPRYRALSDRIINAALKPEQRRSVVLRVRALQKWFWENTTYSLTADHSKAPDPVASYLFGDRRGKCVHLAHAMTMLLRSQGIPARVAGGFCVPLRRRGLGSSLLVQSSDSHSWCETYFEGIGWVVTEAASREREPSPPPDPNPDLQRQLGEMARQDKPGNEDPQDEQTREWVGALVLRFLLVLAAALALLYAVKVWRRLAPRLAGQGQLYRVCYRASLDRLAEVGLYRRFGETREEFAQRLVTLLPEFVELSRAHVRRAVGGTESLDRPAWKDLTGRVRARLAGTYSAFRRLLGALNPVTWVWVS
jgi:hypothetical protein